MVEAEKFADHPVQIKCTECLKFPIAVCLGTSDTYRLQFQYF